MESNKPDKEAIKDKILSDVYYKTYADDQDPILPLYSKPFYRNIIHAAMESFSASQNSELKKENENLKQDAAKMYSSLMDKNFQLQKENEELNIQITKLNDAYNEIYRQANEWKNYSELNLQPQIVQLQSTIEEKDKEIKKLINLIWKAFHLSVCDLPVEEMTEYWNEFKSENNL